MSGVGSRLLGWLVDSESSTSVLPDRVERAVVLGSGEGGLYLGAALANELRSVARSRTALVCCWGLSSGVFPRRSLASRSARKLSTRLEARGITARASGRSVWLELPSEASSAVALAIRALSAVDVPLVVVVGGPRPDEFESVLSEADVVLVAIPKWADQEIRELAAWDVGRVHPEVVPAQPLSKGFGRRLALSGYDLFGSTQAAFHAATDVSRGE